MEKKDFLKGYEDVMGVRLTWENVLLGLAAVLAFLLVLQCGEIVESILSSFHFVTVPAGT